MLKKQLIWWVYTEVEVAKTTFALGRSLEKLLGEAWGDGDTCPNIAFRLKRWGLPMLYEKGVALMYNVGSVRAIGKRFRAW